MFGDRFILLLTLSIIAGVHHFFKMKFIKNCTKIAVNFRRKSSELLIDFRKVLNYNIYKTKSSEPRREECKI